MKKRLLALFLATAMILTGCGGAAGEGGSNVAQEERIKGQEINGIWAPNEAPARNSLPSEKEMEGKINMYLNKGVQLFSGGMNEGYNPDSCDWLKDAKNDKDAILVLRYTCDIPENKNWGVLAWNAVVNGQSIKGTDINAGRHDATATTMVVITMSELAEMFGVTSVSEISNVSLSAWNGGRIESLHYLPGTVAKDFVKYEKELDEAKNIVHTYDGELSNKYASKSAKKVYEYMKEIQGKKCLTGQQESTWIGTPNYEMIYIRENTGGKVPAIRGFDFMHDGFDDAATRGIEWWQQGGIVTITWHTGIDFVSGYDECMVDELNWEKALTPGTAQYQQLLDGIDKAVPALQKLEDAGVPVLWRPFHELDGSWFWWSKGGPENFVKLWQMMYSRYTDYWQLDNLIWVLAYTHADTDKREWYPGDAYVDVVGGDFYDSTKENLEALYTACDTVIPKGMPNVQHECDYILSENERANMPWGYFLVWHTTYITDEKWNTKEHLYEIYNSEYFITRDELPNFNK